MSEHTMFASLPPTRLFFSCAVPGMISMAVISFYTIADGIFVGAYLGADALAAVNLVMPFIMISFSVSDMVAIGSSVQISFRLSRCEFEAAGRIFTFCTLLIVGISCLLGLAAFFFAAPLMHALGADATLTRYAIEYMRVYALFSPAIMIFFAVDNYLRACGWVKYSMVMNVTMSLANIALDWLFLAHFGWGIASAALASCISLSVGTIIGFAPFAMGSLVLRFRLALIPFKTLGTIMSNGSSEFFSNISASLFMVIVNMVLLKLSGSLAVAALSIVLYCNTLVGALLLGMSDSLQPAISYNYGAGNRSRMLALEKRLLAAGACISLSVMLVILAFGNELVSFFIKENDPALLQLSNRAMMLFSFSYLTVWFGVISGSFFTALNMAGISLVLAFCRTLIFPLLFLALLQPAFGLDGVWLTMAAADMLSAVLAALCMVRVLKTTAR